MICRMTMAVLAAAMISTGALAAGTGHSHSHADERAYGEPGDVKKPARVINVVMREADGKMMFVPDRIEVKKGEQIRFMIRNNGEIDHEIVLATLEENLEHAMEMAKNPDMEHDDPNARRLAPKKAGEMVWKFTKSGEFDFSCLMPGHREAGMTGTIIVK